VASTTASSPATPVGNNVLDGGAGSDFLNGATGADTMLGGDGTDSYAVDHAGDLVSESNSSLATGGNDIVYSYLAAYTPDRQRRTPAPDARWREQRHRQRARQHALRW
jgi:Ca2+-binding RTX toxin-like protein